ncbi:VapE domain-containing protein [Bradyrhizobium sp.]|uniref:VapE domain-containing protein n=1 Tax=Bradyrhizobium sp. TaxID=376 RepID=UPI00260F88EF|nr:VapE domain-containing protein [Bradyrhizobium sp.]
MNIMSPSLADASAKPPHRIHVSFFKDEYATSLTTSDVTLEELGALIMDATAPTKNALPWLKGARLGTKRKPTTRSLRHNANILAFSMLHLDYDGGVVSFEEAVERLKLVGLRGLIYTTPSFTPENPRWRMLLATSVERLPAEHDALCLSAMARLGITFGPESRSLSQAYYYGTAKKIKKEDGTQVDGIPVRVEIVDGEFVDIALAGALARSDDRLPANNFTKIKSRTPADRALVERALNVVTDDSYDVWIKIGAALHNEFGEDGFDLFDAWSARSNKYEAGEVQRKWSDCAGMTDITIATVFHFANEAAPGWRGGVPGRPRWRDQLKSGEPRMTLHNARAAIIALGVECKYDVFRSRLFIGQNGQTAHALELVIGDVSDNAIIALRRIISDEFCADFKSDLILDAVISIAIEHRYDPVCDLLDEAEAAWDGQPRLDRMAVDYACAKDRPLNRAFMRKAMIAAVRRARKPGCKFDNIVVLEGPEGWNKSTFWRVLAGDEFYSDESIIGKGSREVQEQLAGVWIHENGELAGMRKAEVESVKAFASRQVDSARPAYGRVMKRQPRHSIDVGTTNADTYLQSQTGNRRFWPLKLLAPIDIAKLTADRLQLWGEAAHHESQGEELTLDPSLWDAAAIEQEARRVSDGWEDILDHLPSHAVEDPQGHVECFNLAEGQTEQSEYIKIVHREDGYEKVSSAVLIRYVLGIRNDRIDRNVSMRLSTVMQRLGWERPPNKITIAGAQVRGYQRPIPDAG